MYLRKAEANQLSRTFSSQPYNPYPALRGQLSRDDGTWSECCGEPRQHDLSNRTSETYGSSHQSSRRQVYLAPCSYSLSGNPGTIGRKDEEPFSKSDVREASGSLHVVAE